MNGSERPRVYFDANAFIEMIEKPGPVSDLLSAFWGGCQPPRYTLVTSELTLGEVLVEPTRLQRSGRSEQYEGLIQNTRDLIVRPIDREIMITAAKLRAEGRCAKLPDAIHLATALQMSCVAIITNDRRIRASDSLAVVNLDVSSLKRLLSA